MKGRKPKPISLRIAGVVGESMAVRNPQPPKHLGKIAQAKWRSIMPLLSQLGTLAEADLTLVEMFCECYQNWRDAKAEARKQGFIFKYGNGGYYPSPLLGISNEMITLSVKLTAELGLSPTARAKLMGAPRGTGKKIIRRVR